MALPERWRIASMRAVISANHYPQASHAGTRSQRAKKP